VTTELLKLEPTKGARKRVVVSLSLAPLTEDQECTVDATLRDDRTGSVVATIETASRASGPLNADQRKLLAYAAVRRAVRKMPTALAGSK
jgi:hypothetical protein